MRAVSVEQTLNCAVETGVLYTTATNVSLAKTLFKMKEGIWRSRTDDELKKLYTNGKNLNTKNSNHIFDGYEIKTKRYIYGMRVY